MRSIRAKLLFAVLITLVGTFLVSTLAQLRLVGVAFSNKSINTEPPWFRNAPNTSLCGCPANGRKSSTFPFIPSWLLLTPPMWVRVAFLQQQHADHLSTYENIIFVDAGLKGISAIRPSVYQDNPAYETLVNTLESRQQHISSPFLSDLTDSFVILIASPILSSNGELVGLLAATLRMQDFSAMLSDLIEPEYNQYAFIVDSMGTIIAHPDASLAGRDNIQTTQAIPGISAQAEEILQHPYGVVAYQGAGAEYAYFRRILGTDGWILIYTAQARAFNRPLTQTRTWLVFSNLLAVALVSSVIYLRAEAITRPLRQMVTVLGDIATGDLTQKVDVVSDDEVGQTARYANLMADGLAGMIQQLKELANIIVTSGQQIAASIEESTSGLEQSSNLATEIGSNMQLNAASIDQTKNAVQYVADSAQMALS